MRPGDRGKAVADLQRRLVTAGMPVPDEPGTFGDATRAAVEAFQHFRGLRVDGVCGHQTWSALVEAGWTLGDRFLYHRNPMLRGDDVADLQRRMSALGFDIGRVDGIFGPRTAAGLCDFQRNMGLPVDGILGAGTVRDLLRVTPRTPLSELVGTVHDRQRLRQTPRTLLGRRIAVGEEGGLDVLVSALRREFGRAGAQMLPVLHPQGSVHAQFANSADAEAYLGFRVEPDEPRCSVSYYSGFAYVSPGGQRLASLTSDRLRAVLGPVPGDVKGMALPVLRETRMPAIVCELGPAVSVVTLAAEVAHAITLALASWVQAPVD